MSDVDVNQVVTEAVDSIMPAFDIPDVKDMDGVAEKEQETLEYEEKPEEKEVKEETDVSEEDDSADAETIDEEEDSVEDIEEEDPDVEEEPAAPVVSPALQMEAARFGMTNEQIMQFSTDGTLRAAIALVQPKQEQAQQEQKAEEETEWFKPQIEDFDEEVAKQLTGVNDQAKEAFVKQEARIKMLEGQLQRQADAQYIQQFENTLDTVKDWGDVVGEGAFDDVTDDQQKARIRVFESVGRLSQPGTETPLKKLIEQSLGLEFPDKVKASVKKGLVAKAKKRKGAKMRKPGAGKAEHVDSEENAIADIKGWINTQGGANEPRWPLAE